MRKQSKGGFVLLAADCRVAETPFHPNFKELSGAEIGSRIRALALSGRIAEAQRLAEKVNSLGLFTPVLILENGEVSP